MRDAEDVNGRPVGRPQGPTGRLFDDLQARRPAGRLEFDGPGPPRISDKRPATGRERVGDHGSERLGMVLLVEHVGRHHEVKLAEVCWNPPPV